MYAEREIGPDPAAADAAPIVVVGAGAQVGDPSALIGSTVLRIVVGAQLRRHREAAGISRQAAADHIRGSAAKISRMELGRHKFKDRDLDDLLTLYRVVDPTERGEFVELARQANSPGWWQQYTDLLPSWFETYLAMEQAASVIRTFEMQFVPGLLQTASYARAVVELVHADPVEIERRVALRLRRQELLTRPDPPRLWMVVDEAVLRRPLVGRDQTRAQLDHLMEVAELPHVTLQIATFGRGPHAATGGAFTILRFPLPDLPDVVYLEQLTGALYLDRPSDVDDYAQVWSRMCVHIDPATETRATLDRIRTEVCGRR